MVRLIIIMLLCRRGWRTFPHNTTKKRVKRGREGSNKNRKGKPQTQARVQTNKIYLFIKTFAILMWIVRYLYIFDYVIVM